MRAAVGKPKRAFEKKTLPAEVADIIKGVVDKEILASSLIKDKKARYDGYKATKNKMVEARPGQGRRRGVSPRSRSSSRKSSRSASTTSSASTSSASESASTAAT